MVTITSDTTKLDVKAKLQPPGFGVPRVEVVLRLAMTECHTWLEIGGRTGLVRRPRPLFRKIWLALDGDGPDDLPSGGDCRRLISGAIKHSLRKVEEYRCLTPTYWDQAVPVGLERAIAIEALRHGGGGRSLEAVVDISIRFEFVYSEPVALRQACDEKDSGGLTGPRSGNGEAPLCSICFEKMSREANDVTDLPGCTHSFHRWCIAVWFDKASTCPVCRRDQLHHLPSDYQDLHDKMTINPES